jgi:hypothetical protein
MPLNKRDYGNIKEFTLKLLEYCRANDFAGYDPYDALNSRVFQALPFLNFRLFRLALTQFFKRSPINFRPLFLVPKTQNPKALALFLMAFLKLRKLGLLENDDLIEYMVERLIALRSPNPEQPVTRNSQPAVGSPQSSNLDYWCWGYSFPWQTRTIIVPRGQANIVCTTFVANALLDLYESGLQVSNASRLAPRASALDPSSSNLSHFSFHISPTSCLEMAISSAEYILSELYWEKGDKEAGFSYPLPKLDNIVHNANFLGAALLCRVYKLTGEKKFLERALKAARYSAGRQREDGSWDYGEAGTQNWVDNFHTGYNLCALKDIDDYAVADEFVISIQKGFQFFVNNFFRVDGAPKYFHNHPFPFDIHSVAQSIITLLRLHFLGEVCDELALKVYKWGANHLKSRRGFFYYQETTCYKNKISYMRWSQAWMLLALSTLLEYEKNRNTVAATG